VPPEIVETLAPPFAFALGAVIGSFLNVVIYRLPRAEEGLTVAYPAQSFCPQCKEPIRGYDNVPIISYFVLAGKCRKCKAKIPLRYFFVELFTATLFALLAIRHEPHYALAAVYAAVTAALIACTFIDIDLQIIPDKIDIPGMVLAPLASALVPTLHGRVDANGVWTFRDLGVHVLSLNVDVPVPLGEPRLAAALSSVVGIAAGAGVIWVIGVLGSVVFRKEAMGFGDVKLLGMIGGFIGWKGVLIALLLACFAGAVIGVIVKLATKDPYIPFGPFLSLGALCMMAARAEVEHVIYVWYPGLF
jgi:leader peptidase (prepilin peptidase)/N-methyltransferase